MQNVYCNKCMMGNHATSICKSSYSVAATKGSGGNVKVAQEDLTEANMFSCSATTICGPAKVYTSASVTTAATGENKFLPNVKALVNTGNIGMCTISEDFFV